jgi:hypothetical protein
MAPTTTQKYTVLGERAAEVDDVRLEPGGDPVELTADQVERLTDAGIEVETPQERGKRLKAAESEASDVPAESTSTEGGDR